MKREKHSVAAKVQDQQAFDEEKEPTDLDIAPVLTEFVPLSKLMAEQIAGLGNWAKGRARLATSLVSSNGLKYGGVESCKGAVGSWNSLLLSFF